MDSIYLIGYMASGKTTFGKALAKRLGRNFIDLDEEIEKRFGMTISQLVDKEGIERFREIETEQLRLFSGCKNLIIACGGGTPCFFDNMEHINSCGISVRLTASPQKTAERVRAAGDTRPLLNNIPEEELEEYILSHLNKREPFYSKAKITFSGEHLETEQEIEESVDRFIERFLTPDNP